MVCYRNIRKIVINTICALVGRNKEEVDSLLHDELEVVGIEEDDKYPLIKEIWENYCLEFPEEDKFLKKIKNISDIFTAFKTRY